MQRSYPEHAEAVGGGEAFGEAVEIFVDLAVGIGKGELNWECRCVERACPVAVGERPVMSQKYTPVVEYACSAWHGTHGVGVELRQCGGYYGYQSFAAETLFKLVGRVDV